MSALRTLLDTVADAIGALPACWRDGVPVISLVRADHVERLKAASAALTLGMAVYPSDMGLAEAEQASPPIVRVRVAILILENLALNRATTHASDLAEQIAALLVNAQPCLEESPLAATGGNRRSQPFALSGLRVASVSDWPAELPSAGRYLALQLEVETFIELDALPAQADAPIFGTSDSRVTLAAGSGAAIYYTLDGSIPTHTAGTRYTGPFIPPAGTVRARAYVADKVASDVAEDTYV